MYNQLKLRYSSKVIFNESCGLRVALEIRSTKQTISIKRINPPISFNHKERFTTFVLIYNINNESMRKFLLAFVAILCFCPVIKIHAQSNYTISGNLNSVLNRYDKNSKISAVYIKSGNMIITDKVEVASDGSFTLSGQVDKPMEANLVVDVIVPGGTGQSSVLFVLEKGQILVNDFTKFEGTPLNDAVYNEVNYLQQSSETSEFKIKHISAFIEQYKQTPAVAMVLSRLSIPGMFTMEEILHIINTSDKHILQSPFVNAYVSNIKRYLDRAKSYMATGEGQMFVDLEVEHNGETKRLSDYVGKGKYVLLDMWASWCAPCKAEIPNLRELHNTYKDKGLTVLGLFVWDKKENLKKAMEEEGIDWPQLFDKDMTAPKIYGVSGIPHIILFAPDGTILMRRLRGQHMIDVVNELMKKQ